MLQLKLTHDTTAITSFARNTDSAKDGFCAHTKDSQLRLRTLCRLARESSVPQKTTLKDTKLAKGSCSKKNNRSPVKKNSVGDGVNSAIRTNTSYDTAENSIMCAIMDNIISKS